MIEIHILTNEYIDITNILITPMNYVPDSDWHNIQLTYRYHILLIGSIYYDTISKIDITCNGRDISISRVLIINNTYEWYDSSLRQPVAHTTPNWQNVMSCKCTQHDDQLTTRYVTLRVRHVCVVTLVTEGKVLRHTGHWESGMCRHVSELEHVL